MVLEIPETSMLIHNHIYDNPDAFPYGGSDDAVLLFLSLGHHKQQNLYMHNSRTYYLGRRVLLTYITVV